MHREIVDARVMTCMHPDRQNCKMEGKRVDQTRRWRDKRTLESLVPHDNRPIAQGHNVHRCARVPNTNSVEGLNMWNHGTEMCMLELGCAQTCGSAKCLRVTARDRERIVWVCNHVPQALPLTVALWSPRFFRHDHLQLKVTSPKISWCHRGHE